MKKHITLSFILCLSLSAMAQWTQITPPVSAQRLLVDGNTLYLGGYGSMAKSTDNGATWSIINTGLQSPLSNCTGLIQVGSRLVASYGGNGNHYVYYSDNEGISWTLDTANWAPPIVLNIRPFSRITLNYQNTHTICVLESNYILYKTNAQTQWSRMSVPASHRTPNAVHLSGDTIFLFQLRTIDFTSDVVYTTNLGDTWDTLPTRSNINVRNVPYQNKLNNTIYTGLVTGAGQFDEAIWSSSDNGRVWDTLSNRTFNTKNTLTGLWAEGDLLIATFAASNQDTLRKVMQSDDGGATWTDLTGNIMSLIPFKFQPMLHPTRIGNSLWVIQGGTILSRPLDGINPTGTHEMDGEQEAYSVYPNPATYSITLSGDVKEARMYTTQGQYVATLSPDSEIDIAYLPSGIYWLEMQLKSGSIKMRKLVKN